MSGSIQSSASAGTNHLVADTPALATPSLDSGVVGVPYAMQLVASGGVAPYSFSATGLPAGFSLSTSGLLSGTGSAAGTANVVITVTDDLNQSASTTLTLTLVDQLTVATTSLPNGLVDAPYEQSLIAVGGRTPYVWSLDRSSRPLPRGLRLDPNTGVLSGTPTVLGTSPPFMVRVTDADNRTAGQILTLTTDAPTIRRFHDNDGRYAPISGRLTPDGGGTTCALDDQETLVVNVDDLGAPRRTPEGFQLNNGLFKLRMQGCTPGKTQLRVRLVYPNALKRGTRYWKYGRTRQRPENHWYLVTGAKIKGNVIEFTITDGDLGDDDLSANGAITDPGGPGEPTLAIGGAPGAGTQGSAYSAALTPIDGIGPYVWSLAAGGLPPGVALNAANGDLSGTPTLAGSFNFTVQLVDTGNDNISTTQAFTVTINPSGGGGGGVTPTNGACGSAHGGLFYDLPSSPRVLCASGTASAVSGSGPWTWSCAGLNGGTTASCQAALAPPGPTDLPPVENWPDWPDGDGDSVPEVVETQVPGWSGAAGPVIAGDGNGDGLPDTEQVDVSSLPWVENPDGTTRWVTLTNAAGLVQAWVRTQPAPADRPPELELPLGLLSFQVAGVEPGGRVSFSVFIDADIPVNGYYKRDAGGTWHNLATAIVSAGNKIRIDFALEDGGPFDTDGQANGTIVDPGAPGWLAGCGGSPTWQPLAADWQGAGRATIGLFDPGRSVYWLSADLQRPQADWRVRYGPSNAGWIALLGDWDGDGQATLGLYDPSRGVFHLRNSNTAGTASLSFRYGPPGAGWWPIAGDWDGDGVSSIGLFDPDSSTFFLRETNTAGRADHTFRYGPRGASWRAVTGDWNGDGVSSIGLFNPDSGTVFLRETNTAGRADHTFRYGPRGADWFPIAGDWNQDGIATIGLYDPQTQTFFLRDSHRSGKAEYPGFYGTRILDTACVP